MIEEGTHNAKRPERERKIAIALSGGGHRACLFALGALLYLVDAGKGSAIASVSSVSGGSLANGVLAQGLDLRSAGPGDLGPIASRVAGQITSRGTLFGSAWTIAYLLLVGLATLASVALPWFLPIAGALKVVLLLAGLLLTAWLLSARGRVCALAFDRTLFLVNGRSTRLADVHKGVDHVFCATDLHAGEHVYFSGGFVDSYRFGVGEPGDVKLSTVVQASAAFPGAFPASWLPTKRHRFSGGAQKEAARTRRMALVDGGVYDNMADQWAWGMSSRRQRHLPSGLQARSADELVVVNSSPGLDWGRLRGLRLPAVGELLTLLRDKSALYDNGNSLRREALVSAFKAAEAGSGGLRGALVHIPQSPFLVPRKFAGGGDAAAERARAALAALTESDGDEAERRWAKIARENAEVATTLVSFDVATASRLLHHAYVLAMVNLHVILGYPLLTMPDPGRFDAIAAGEEDPRTNLTATPRPGGVVDFFTHTEPDHHKHRPEEQWPYGEPPRRAYARLDRFDPDGVGGGRLAYECIDADWFDEVGRDVRWLGDPAVAGIGERISIVEEQQDSEQAAKLEGAWFELEFETGEQQIEQYLNLFAEPLLRSMSATAAHPEADEALSAKTGFSKEIEDATESEIESLLESLAAPSAAAVYDVGQGSSNAVLSGGLPVLYFDVGGGATANTKTFPVPLRRFCVSSDPPVVLSHWDWDHWSSAYRDRRLLDRRWIVPRHNGQLGAVHTRLLGDLYSRGRLFVWPSNLTSISGSSLAVEQCTGSPGDRNNSGLALVLEGEVDGQVSRMLFPGDAAYDNVPSAHGDFTSIAIPHHGGRTPTTQIPASDGRSPGRLVLSYGAGNAYWHPFPDVGRAHRKAGWKTRLHTALRDERGLGHVHLHWSDNDPLAVPPCGAISCDLGCHQR